MRKKYSKVIQPYVDHLNAILNATITDSRLATLESEAAPLLVMRFQDDQILPLELGDGKWLHFRQLVVEQGQKIDVVEARYILSFSSDVDDDEKHVFRWEYIREPPERYIPQSHLHLYGNNSNIGRLERVHFPTRRLSVEQIIAHLIIEYNVPPRAQKWFEILAKGHLDFLKRTRETEQTLWPFP